MTSFASLPGVSVSASGIFSSPGGVETPGINAGQFNSLGVSGGGSAGDMAPSIAFSLASASASGVAAALTASIT